MEIRNVLVPLDIVQGHNRIVISFHIDAPRTPVQLKWPDPDTRPLGFRLTRFRLSAVPKYELGRVIDLTKGDKTLEYLKSRWSLPDGYEVWTIGAEATMILRFKEAPPVTAIQASFLISDCMVSESFPELLVRVKANGRLVAEWRFSRPEATPALDPVTR